jgi:hypothetical protein
MGTSSAWLHDMSRFWVATSALVLAEMLLNHGPAAAGFSAEIARISATRRTELAAPGRFGRKLFVAASNGPWVLLHGRKLFPLTRAEVWDGNTRKSGWALSFGRISWFRAGTPRDRLRWRGRPFSFSREASGTMTLTFDPERAGDRPTVFEFTHTGGVFHPGGSPDVIFVTHFPLEDFGRGGRPVLGGWITLRHRDFGSASKQEPTGSYSKPAVR